MLSRVMLAGALLALSTPVGAIEGRYRIEGTNPGNPAVYRGEAIVKRSGDTYAVAWQTGTTRQIGTGIRTGDMFSVVFQTVGTNSYGAASFAIVQDRITNGTWTVLGAQVVGTEHWAPLDAP